jgi:3-phenylpropionate/trans-cinnamate dioxygenase ferredoxin reductase subunit
MPDVVADVIVIGAGHAGVTAAAELHKLDPNLVITLISNEEPLPYHRPPLSKKAVFDAELPLELLQSEAFYAAEQINLLRGTSVTSINRGQQGGQQGVQQSVELDSGQSLAYGQLIIATGSCLRQVPVVGGELAMGVYNYADIQRLGPKLQAANRVLVIGGGFIGCEVAAGALQMGKQVDLLITGPRALRKALAPAMGERVTQLHQANGMGVHTGCQVSRIDAAGAQFKVHTNQGIFSPDLVIAGVGVDPNIDLAAAAGLELENGILVNEFGQTSDPNIYAMGDVASFPLHGKIQRLESIQNATDQSQLVATNMLAQRRNEAPKAYNPTPWFWSDQGELKLQMAGLGDVAAEHITLETSTDTSMTSLHFREGVMIAVDTLNMPGNHIAARKLLAMPVDITWQMVQDSAQELKKLFKLLR